MTQKPSATWIKCGKAWYFIVPANSHHPELRYCVEQTFPTTKWLRDRTGIKAPKWAIWLYRDNLKGGAQCLGEFDTTSQAKAMAEIDAGELTH